MEGEAGSGAGTASAKGFVKALGCREILRQMIGPVFGVFEAGVKVENRPEGGVEAGGRWSFGQ